MGVCYKANSYKGKNMEAAMPITINQNNSNNLFNTKPKKNYNKENNYDNNEIEKNKNKTFETM